MSDDFDFEAFISGAQLARRTVGAYKIDHRDEIVRLHAEHDAAAKTGGDRESSKGAHKALAERIQALRDEMEASRIEFEIRTLTPDEYRRLREDDALNEYDQLATQSVAPKLTADQWRKVADVIGAAQFGEILSDASNLVTSKVAVPDFSPSVSMTLSQQASSPN